MKNKTITDEKVIAALISSSTLSEAARKLGISRRTLYSKFEDPQFREKYDKQSTLLIINAAMKLEAATGDAIQALTAIVIDPEARDCDRIRAAQTILNCGTQYYELSQNLNQNDTTSAKKEDPLSIALEAFLDDLTSDIPQ